MLLADMPRASVGAGLLIFAPGLAVSIDVSLTRGATHEALQLCDAEAPYTPP